MTPWSSCQQLGPFTLNFLPGVAGFSKSVGGRIQYRWLHQTHIKVVFGRPQNAHFCLLIFGFGLLPVPSTGENRKAAAKFGPIAGHEIPLDVLVPGILMTLLFFFGVKDFLSLFLGDSDSSNTNFVCDITRFR